MLETNKTEVNVNDLMRKIRKEVAGRNNNILQSTVLSSFSQSLEINLVANHIEALLTNAESRAYVRTKWPDKLNRFPFNLANGLQKIVLKAINFLFKDQREVNFALIQALRECIKLNRQITEQMSDFKGQMSDFKGQLVSVNSRIQGIDTRTVTNDAYIKNDLMQQKRLITMFLEEARKRLPEPFTKDELQNFVNEEHALDAFYVAFEDEFRGSREDIYERLKVYIPVLEAANIGCEESLILDVGCGRGEWLELLNSFGYKAKGIDINRIMLEQCAIKGLEVTEADAIDYLKSLPDESLSGVTGFHIIEHLSFEILIKLFDEIVRVLRPSGILIFETPNARNILVGSGDFYRDPTHKNPIHPDTISFIARSRGLINSESYFFENIDGVLSLVRSSTKQFDDLSKYVNVSRDTALIAYKASK